MNKTLSNGGTNVEKGRYLTQSYDKRPYTHRKSKKQRDDKKRHQNFDYTAIADRLRTVSWSNSSYPTGVVKPVYERSTFPLTATAVLSKGHTFEKFVNNPPYRDWGPTANQSGEVIKYGTQTYTNGQKKGYTVYMSNYSKVKLKH